MNTEELDKFVSDFEKKQIDYFKELEEAIEEVDLSKETKEHLIFLYIQFYSLFINSL